MDVSQKPPLKKIRWFCPDVVCNPDAVTMADEEVWANG